MTKMLSMDLRHLKSHFTSFNNSLLGKDASSNVFKALNSNVHEIKDMINNSGATNTKAISDKLA